MMNSKAVNKKTELLMVALKKLGEKKKLYQEAHCFVGKLNGVEEVTRFYGWLGIMVDAIGMAEHELICIISRLED